MSKLAINGGRPVRTKSWPIWPVCGQEESDQLQEVLNNVQDTDRLWGGLFPCPKAAQIEQELADYHGCRYGIAMSTGAAALELALYAIGLDLGDEVLSTPMTWVACATAVLRAGGVPVFVDIEPERYGIDPDRLEAAITPRTRAIIPVHLAGYPARIDNILEVADKHGLPVIEDCAQAHGTFIDGRPVGSFGQISCFSFQNSKFMASGEGGMILTNDEKIWRRCHSYKDCGRVRDITGYVRSDIAFEQEGWGFGYNYRLTEFQAAVLLAQLGRLEEHKKIRMANARLLCDALTKMGGLHPQELHEGQNIWRLIFNYDSGEFGGLPLDDFIEAVRAEGIPFQHFPLHPLPEEGLYRGYLRIKNGSPGLQVNPRDYDKANLPVATWAYEHIVYFQHNVLLADGSDMEDIIEAIAKIKRHASELR